MLEAPVARLGGGDAVCRILCQLHVFSFEPRQVAAVGASWAYCTTDRTPKANSIAHASQAVFIIIFVHICENLIWWACMQAAADQLSSNAFRAVMEIDTLGTFNASRAAFSALESSGNSCIINISATLHYGATWWQVSPADAHNYSGHQTAPQRHLSGSSAEDTEWQRQPAKAAPAAPLRLSSDTAAWRMSTQPHAHNVTSCGSLAKPTARYAAQWSLSDRVCRLMHLRPRLLWTA